jgi:hypothetical protein
MESPFSKQSHDFGIYCVSWCHHKGFFFLLFSLSLVMHSLFSFQRWSWTWQVTEGEDKMGGSYGTPGKGNAMQILLLDT